MIWGEYYLLIGLELTLYYYSDNRRHAELGRLVPVILCIFTWPVLLYFMCKDALQEQRRFFWQKPKG